MKKDLSIDDIAVEEDIEMLASIAIRLEEKGDTDSAAALYRIGVKLGDVVCMTRLADLLSEPPSFPDIKTAEALYKQACVAGHAPGCRNLAILYKQLGKTVLHQKYMRLAKARGDVWQLEGEEDDDDSES